MTEKQRKLDLVPKKSLADELRDQIVRAAGTAQPADHKKVADIIKRATGAAFSTDIVTLSAGMCALFFLNHNSRNRVWRPGWTQELARRMTTGQWKRNSMSISFYNDGTIADFQHRAAAAAIAGHTMEVVCVFGLEKDAIDTVDAGSKRSGADHAGLDGVTDSPRKQSIVKAAAAYFVRAGDSSAALRSESEIKSSIETNDGIIGLAIEIGETAANHVAGGGVLKPSILDTLAYIMLKTGRTAEIATEWLKEFQSGVSKVGENDPMFVAAQIIESRRKKQARGEKLNATKEIGIAIFALLQSEQGVRSIQPKHVKAAVDGKTVPNPRYSGHASEQAA